MDHEFIWRVPRTAQGLRDALKLVTESSQWPESALTGLNVFIPNQPNEPLLVCFVVDGDDSGAPSVISWLDEVAFERTTDVTLNSLVAQIGSRYGMISGPTEVVLAGLKAYGGGRAGK